MEETALHPSFTIIEELYKVSGNLNPDFIKKMNEIFAEDEKKNGPHSLEFRRGLLAGVYFEFLAFHQSPPKDREHVLASIPAYVSSRFMEHLSIMAPRSPMH